MKNSLTLKWGTLKGWELHGDEKSQEILARYYEHGVMAGCMMQRDTPEQKAIICELIDAVDGEIHNDWSGEIMTKDAAKNYVIEYGQRERSE